MESLPVEVIGNILSHVAVARDVVVASATCRKWREAARHHLHRLCFNTTDWHAYKDFTASQCEVLITETILQTDGLQDLSICMGNSRDYSAAAVIAWLMCTRETLRSLTYMMHTSPNVNILEKCGRHRLEKLVLGYVSIPTVDPSFQKFPSLLSLTLNQATVSALDLNMLLSACSKLESLSLIDTDITLSDAQSTMEINSGSLNTIFIDELSVDNITLEADKLENLILKNSSFEHFELISKGSLRILRIDNVSIMQLDIGESTDLLEVVDFSDFTIMWPRFYQMISRASKLRKLRLWGLPFDAEEEVMDLETIALSFPRLSQLSLNYELGDGLYRHAMRGSSSLEKVVVLELGTTKIHDLFAQWIAGILERCPHLKRLLVVGEISDAKCHEDYQVIGRFTTFMVNLMRRFPHVDVKFEYS